MAANPYHIIRNETATPMDLWDRGFRRCVALLQKAKTLMPPVEPSQRLEKARMLHDAFAIVEFWAAALPAEDGTAEGKGGLPPRLRRAYEYIQHRMVKANIQDCPDDIDEALIMLNHLASIFHRKPGQD
ncbi:MAG: flagellar protein FliS [Acidithiobacillus sp.]